MKIDFKKNLKAFYLPSAKVVAEVNLPAMNYLMIDGQGDPNSSADYAAAIEALFSVSYTLKFSIKKGEPGIDYGVMPLEGLWWADDMSVFHTDDKSAWKWTMMIMQPDFITSIQVDKAIETVTKKKNLLALAKLRFASFTEGPAAQILHIGPFSEEGPTIERVHNFIDERGVKSGKHHEIYLSDIRRADPKKWKTVIRQPFTPNSASM